MSKWLHEFVINKQETSTESHSETNDKGEKITTEKDVVKEIVKNGFNFFIRAFDVEHWTKI